MYLTISKRFEFAASYRYYNPALTSAENERLFGRMAGGEHGFGGNFEVWFVFSGPIDKTTGMIINVSDIKERVGELIEQRYDHKYLNINTPPFDKTIPTLEALASQLFEEVALLFGDSSASLVTCHLSDLSQSSATAYEKGKIERHYYIEFSSSRRTCSPNLSQEENEQLFGISASESPHGHGYKLKVTLSGEIDGMCGMIVDDMTVHSVLDELYQMLDHRYLNDDVEILSGMPMTTECLARVLFEWLKERLPVVRVKLWENNWFFVEYGDTVGCTMSVRSEFRAAHRLHSQYLSDAENLKLYGKCNNLAGHGHLYKIEATVGGDIDERTGALFPLDQFIEGIDRAIGPWKFCHLNNDTDDFDDFPSTSENMIKILGKRIDDSMQISLHRLRIWETPNNRFTLRKQK